VKVQKFPRACLQKDSLSLVCVCMNLVNCIDIHRKSEKWETNFASSPVKITTTFAKVVYTLV
jgi:hypothetical protein